MRSAFRTWVQGILAAAISGAANGVTVAVIDPLQFNLGAGLRRLLSVVVISALIGVALYLQQSPLPPQRR